MVKMLEIVSSDKLLGTVGQTDKPREPLEPTPGVIKINSKSSTYQPKSASKNGEAASPKKCENEKLDAIFLQRREDMENKESVKVTDPVSNCDMIKPMPLFADIDVPRKGKIIKQFHQKIHICCFRGDSSCSEGA